MKLVVHPSEASPDVITLPSKLHTQVACAVGLLGRGRAVIREPFNVRDTRVMLKLAEALDAIVGRSGKNWVISPPESLKLKVRSIDVKNSGTALALMASILPLLKTSVVLTGDMSVRSRPVPALLSLLGKLGAEIHSVGRQDSPPLVVFGAGLQGGIVKPSVSELRYLTPALVSSPFTEIETTIILPDEKFGLFVEPALEIMKCAGAKISRSKRKVTVSRGKYKSFTYSVRKEISASAPFVLAPLLTRGEATVELFDFSARDALFLKLLSSFGVSIKRGRKKLYLRVNKLRGVSIDLSNLPELLPFFAVLATFANGTTHITGAQEAKHMKSDRIEMTTVGLRRMGAKVLQRTDGVIIKGPNRLKGAEVDGANDYAVSSAFILAALRANDEIKIKNGLEALKRCYPNFVKTFRNQGVDISLAVK